MNGWQGVYLKFNSFSWFSRSDLLFSWSFAGYKIMIFLVVWRNVRARFKIVKIFQWPAAGECFCNLPFKMPKELVLEEI